MKLKKPVSVLVAAAMLLTVVSLSFSAFAETSASQQVVDAIEALPEDYMIPVSDQNQVLETLNAYQSLTQEQKAQVTNYDKLQRDVASLSSLADVWLVYNGNGGTTGFGDTAVALKAGGREATVGNNIFSNGYDFLGWATDLSNGLIFSEGKGIDTVDVICDLVSRDDNIEENSYKYYYYVYANSEDLKADLAEASDPSDPYGSNAGQRAVSRDENGNPVKAWQISLYAVWDNADKTPVVNTYISNYPDGVGEYSEKYATVYEGYNGYTIENPFEEIAVAETHKIYLFSGWQDENGNIISAGEQYTDDAVGVTGASKFLATWKEETRFNVTYEINYPADAGLEQGNFTEVVTDEKYKTLTWAKVAAKGYTKPENYKLTGWNTQPDGSGTAYGVNKKLEGLTEDITLYGVWAQAMKFTYYSNYPGAMEQKDTVKTWDAGTTQKIDSISSLSGFDVPEGYVFSGKWNTAADGTGTSYDADSTITVTENLNLYAQWTKLAETVISYASNDKDGRVSTRIVYGDASKGIDVDTIYLTTDDFANIAGFLSWNTKADGSGEGYVAGAKITVTGDITLYAQWESTVHELEFALLALPEKAEVSSESTEQIRNARNAYNALSAEQQAMIRSYGRLTGAEAYTVPYDVWVIYDGNGGSISSDGSKRKIVSDRYQIGDTFVSSVNVFSNINTDTGLGYPFVEWGTSISGGLTFGEKANVKVSDVLGQFMEAPTGSSRSDYFGYVYASDEDRKLDENEAMIAGTANTGSRSIYKNAAGEGIKVWQIKLFAIWDNIEEKYVSNIYHANFPEAGKSLEPGAVSQEVTVGYSAYTLDNPFEDAEDYGLIFDHWSTEPDDSGDYYDEGEEYTDPVNGVEEAVEFYAIWEEEEMEYIITYDSNDEYGDYFEYYVYGVGYAPNEEYVIGCPAEFSNEGYFYGWNTDPDGRGTSYDEDDIILVTEDITLYAQWDEDVDTGEKTAVAGAIVIAAASAGLFFAFKKKR